MVSSSTDLPAKYGVGLGTFFTRKGLPCIVFLLPSGLVTVAVTMHSILARTYHPAFTTLAQEPLDTLGWMSLSLKPDTLMVTGLSTPR